MNFARMQSRRRARELERAAGPGEIVAALRAFGMSPAEVAAVTQMPGQLTQLRDLALLLSDSLTPRGVGQWLHASSRMLAGRRPVEILAGGDYAAVRRAAEAFTDGAYV